MLRHYGYAAAGQFFSVGLAVFALAIVTRSLGPADYGTYIVQMTMVSLLAVATGAGPQAAALVISAREPGRRAELHGQLVVAALALLLVTVGAAAVLAGPIAVAAAPTLDPWIVAVNIIRLPAVVYASLVTSQLSGAGKVGTAAWLAVVSAIVALLGPIGALVSPDALAGAMIGTSLAGYVSAAIAGAFAVSAFGLRRPAGFDAWLSALKLAVPMHIGTVAYWAMLRLDVIVVNAVLGRHDAGIYGLALGVSERVGLLTSPLYNATAWRVSGPDRGAALRTMLQVARLELGFGIAAALGGVTFGPILVQLVSGRDYSAAAVPLAILVVGAAVLPVWAAVGLYLVTHLGGAWTTARIQVAVAIGSVLGYLILTRLAGTTGAAMVSTGAYLVLLACGLIVVRRADPFPWSALLPTAEVARLWAMARHRGSVERGPVAGPDDSPLVPPRIQ